MKEIRNKLVEILKHQILENSDNVCTAELGEVMDMLKDIYEMKKYESEIQYYGEIVEAMKNSSQSDKEYYVDNKILKHMYYKNPVGKSSAKIKEFKETSRSNKMNVMNSFFDALVDDINEMMTELNSEERVVAQQKVVELSGRTII